MADLEQAESADEGRSREWTARAVHAARDPAWTADGFVSERWMPFSPVSGRIDAFEWKAPVAELGRRPVEAGAEEQPSRPMIEVAASDAAPTDPDQKLDHEPELRPVVEPRVPKAASRPSARSSPKSSTKPAPMVESVVPITHVPDDPGPDPYQEPEPLPEPTSGGTGWKRLFQ
jgi:HemY protein